MTAEKRFTSSTMVEHKELVDFSGLLVSIETWLFEFKEKQANMTSTNSFTNLADSEIGEEIDLEAEIFQAISWNMSSTMNSTSSHSTSSDTPHYHQFIQAHTPRLSPTLVADRYQGSSATTTISTSYTITTEEYGQGYAQDLGGGHDAYASGYFAKGQKGKTGKPPPWQGQPKGAPPRAPFGKPGNPKGAPSRPVP